MFLSVLRIQAGEKSRSNWRAIEKCQILLDRVDWHSRIQQTYPVAARNNWRSNCFS
ncbi:MAG: hypothetical protein MUE44_07475 [Oscillatoriaceae cyanobacterium Prado104]|nr:hypothetical protein [Oscillatoriaceae cyanobacterium Prado104]